MRRSIVWIFVPLCLFLAACNLNNNGAAIETVEPLEATTEIQPTSTTSPATNPPQVTSTPLPTTVPNTTGSTNTTYERYPNLPRVGDVAGMPAQDVCWASNQGGGVLVYAQPLQPESSAIAILSNRAILTEMHNAGYYGIQFPEQHVNGGMGWVDADEAVLIGSCGDGAGLGSPTLPIHQDPGSPPTNACVAVHPGGIAEIFIYNPAPGQGVQIPFAMLGNWAEVKAMQGDWIEVILGPNETGWILTTVTHNSPNLIGDCNGL